MFSLLQGKLKETYYTGQIKKLNCPFIFLYFNGSVVKYLERVKYLEESEGKLEDRIYKDWVVNQHLFPFRINPEIEATPKITQCLFYQQPGTMQQTQEDI